MKKMKRSNKNRKNKSVMEKRFLKLLILPIITGIVITICITKFVKADITTVAGLATACNTAPVTDGLGVVTLSNSLTIQNETATISAPCEVHLTNGANLRLNNSKIITDKFAIVDDVASNAPSTITLNNSSLTSTTGGLFIKLYHANDSISVQHTTFDYPLSVDLITTAAQSTLQVEASTITSNGPSSEGIIFASKGKGQFVGNNFSTTSIGNVAILHASTCTMINNTNTIPQCSTQ